MVAPIRFLSGRQQQQKLGILDSTENDKVLEVVGRVGIGSTIFDADYNLDVRGAANISGILSVGQIISGAGNSFSDLYVSGLSTFTSDVDILNNLTVDGLSDLDELNVSGVSTFSSDLDINASVDISNNLTVDGLSDLDELNVSGVSTFSSDIYVGASLYDSNNLDGNPNEVLLSTGSGVVWTTLDESGIAGGLRIGDATAGLYYITASNVNSGVSTAGFINNQFVLDQNGNIGIGSTQPTAKLDVNGDVNITGIATIYQLDVDQLSPDGIDYGNANQVPVADGSGGWEWLTITNAGVGILDAIVILDEGSLIGTSGTVTTLDFKGNNIIASGEEGSYIGTITVSDTPTFDSLYVSGLSTFTSDVDINASVDISTNLTVDGLSDLDELNVAGISTFTGAADFNGNVDIDGFTELDDVNVSGAITATTFSGDLSGNAGTATALETARIFEITGDVVASAISFDGTGNVSLAATIQPNSIGLGTDTVGDYVESISGTANQITVTGGSGEGSTPTLSIPNQFTIPQDATVTRDLSVLRDLNVTGNITVGGTSATLFTSTLKVEDADIILGIRTDAFGNDVSTDTTANHGGIAIASTEGNPLVDLYVVGIETVPTTYKKIMWFKEGTFTGLGTDAWLSNYAIGIGSTQLPTGTRLAAGNVQITEDDISVVRNIKASGIATLPTIDATNATIDSLTFTSGTAITSVDTDLTAVSASDDTLASAKAIKNYVDINISTNNQLNFTDGTTSGRININSESLSILGTNNEVDVQVTSEGVGVGNTITIGLPNDVTISNDLTVSNNLNVTSGVSTFQNIEVTGNINVNDTTVVGSETTSLSTLVGTTIHAGLSVSIYRSVEYNIQATQGTNYHVTKILALHNGTTAYHNEYGTIFNNSSVASFDVVVSGGDMRLVAIGATSDQTDYVINFTATKL